MARGFNDRVVPAACRWRAVGRDVTRSRRCWRGTWGWVPPNNWVTNSRSPRRRPDHATARRKLRLTGWSQLTRAPSPSHLSTIAQLRTAHISDVR
ncbi:hypothetical protein GUJ93_ZPchr0007g5603 [Zizania palustris]|uniref:Uncharacterized protein n=1 Tax=Zizania palustris TaxID=103762 RepID=A0A8J5TCX8_ZIZPA|nr:hypothetical protein GUJ93_ZPchr0007g5603 [Zizania palustris]